MADEIKEEEHLKEFLLNIDCLDELKEWYSDINFFEIAGIVNVEIKHSNVLSWLFDAKQNHGLGDKIIKRFLQKVMKDDRNKEKNLDVFDILLADFYDFDVKRESNNLDIFFSPNDEKNKITITIENKWDSTESIDQTKRYREEVELKYKGYTNFLIFLTKDGSKAKDKDFWYIADYKMIADTISEIMKERKKEISLSCSLILENYEQTIRRFIMDEKLVAKCQEIYNQHKDALDLIYAYRESKVLKIADVIKTQLDGNNEFEIFSGGKNNTSTSVNSKEYSFISNCIKSLFDGKNDKLFYNFRVSEEGVSFRKFIYAPWDETTMKILENHCYWGKKIKLPLKGSTSTEMKILSAEEIKKFDKDVEIKLREEVDKILDEILKSEKKLVSN